MKKNPAGSTLIVATNNCTRVMSTGCQDRVSRGEEGERWLE